MHEAASVGVLSQVRSGPPHSGLTPIHIRPVLTVPFGSSLCSGTSDWIQDFGPVKTSKLSYNCRRQTDSYIIKPQLVFGQIRIKRKLTGWRLGAPWAATGSLLHQFESSSTSAEGKQNCLSTNNTQTNKQTSKVWQSSVDTRLHARFISGSKLKWFLLIWSSVAVLENNHIISNLLNLCFLKANNMLMI